MLPTTRLGLVLGRINMQPDYVYNILNILNLSDQPLGCGRIRNLLEDEGIKRGEATVGRILLEMDSLGLTKKLGFEGRAITEKGEDKLEELNTKRRHMQISDQLMDILKATKKEELVDVLEARRGIEGELARLAALRATDKEIELLKANLLKQERNICYNDYSHRRLV